MPIVLFAMGAILSTMTQAADWTSNSSIDVRAYRVQVQILQNADMKVTEKLDIASAPNLEFQRELPVRRIDQKGHRWIVQYHQLRAYIDGESANVQEFSGETELLLRINKELKMAPVHSLTLEYLASNAVRKIDGSDQLSLTWGGRWPISALEVSIIPPPSVPIKWVELSGATQFTPVATMCDCAINREAQAVLIRTTRPLQRNEQLAVKASFPAGHLNRSYFQALEGLEENNPGITSWLIFIVSVCGYVGFIVTLGMAIQSKRARTLDEYRQSMVAGASGLAAGLSLITLAVVGRPEVAMPGILGGMLLSMVGGTAHGPRDRYLWIPLALAINTCFYYLLLRGLQLVWRRRIHGKRNKDPQLKGPVKGINPRIG